VTLSDLYRALCGRTSNSDEMITRRGAESQGGSATYPEEIRSNASDTVFGGINYSMDAPARYRNNPRHAT